VLAFMQDRKLLDTTNRTSSRRLFSTVGNTILAEVMGLMKTGRKKSKSYK